MHASPPRMRRSGRRLNRCSIMDIEGDGCIGRTRQSVAQKGLSNSRRRCMLKSIDPMLNADVLYALRAMGHGDDLVICDTNFPADAVPRHTVLGQLLRIHNITSSRAPPPILSVPPLNSLL